MFGFQNQEEDDEVKGEGNSINYKYRMHDPRIGRFFAIDPLAAKYPFYSPYAFSGNRVIDAIELEGLEPVVINGVLVGYSVQKGQSFWTIAKDINNPETQKKYGYSLTRAVGYKELIEYSGHNKTDIIHTGDRLNFEVLKTEQNLENAIPMINERIEIYKDKIEQNQEKIDANNVIRKELDKDADEKIKKVVEPDPGDPQNHKTFTEVLQGGPNWLEDYDLQQENKWHENKIKDYESKIYSLRKSRRKLQESLDEIKENAKEINSKP